MSSTGSSQTSAYTSPLGLGDPQYDPAPRRRQSYTFNPLAPVTLVLAILLTWYAFAHHVYSSNVVSVAIVAAAVAAVLIAVYTYCVVTKPHRVKVVVASAAAVAAAWLLHDWYRTVFTGHVIAAVLVTLGYLVVLALSAFELPFGRR